MKEYTAGSFEWSRGNTFLQQCADPLRRDIEPAMAWRLLPPFVAHVLHLPGYTPFVIPWAGILANVIYVSVLLRRGLNDYRFVLGGTVLFATTSAVLVPVGWLGMNDSWVWLGLLAVSFGKSRWAVPLSCLLCPWIDERFIIGFPVAWLLARFDRNEPVFGVHLLNALWLLPYAAVRLLISTQNPAVANVSTGFLHTQIAYSVGLLPLAPLAWWMGLRAAWLAVACALFDLSRFRALLVLGVFATTLGISFLLAADMSRSVAIASPLILAGCLSFARRHQEIAPRAMLLIGGFNLLIPAAHVVAAHIQVIDSLPIELYRLLR